MEPFDNEVLERLGYLGFISTFAALGLGAALTSAVLGNKLSLVPGFLLATVGFGLVAWGEWEKNKPVPRGTQGPVTRTRSLSLRLMWRHQFQFIGIYRAQEKLNASQETQQLAGNKPKNDREQRFSLKVVEGGSPTGLDPRATVSNGLDELGITSVTALIRWYLQRRTAPDAEKLVPLLVIFHRSPACLIYRADTSRSAEGLKVDDLTAKRFRVVDPDDPATMELHALCRHNHVADLRWDLSLISEEGEDDPTQNLQAGSAADYRLGYSFNEGYRSEHCIDSHGAKYSYALLADVFTQQELYADVLFTRLELLKLPEIRKLVESVKESYAYFVNVQIREQDRLAEVNKYMELHCRDWWHRLIGRKAYDNTAHDLLELLADAWGAQRTSESLGRLECWKIQEEAVSSELDMNGTQRPHLEWLKKNDTVHWLA